MAFKSILVYLMLPFELFYICLYAICIRLRNIFRLVFPGAPINLAGEVILVTGGANGIGRAVCRELVTKEKNLTLIIWDVNEKATLEAVTELRSMGVEDVFAFNVDISNREQVASAAEKIQQEIGDVTIIFNNAGISGNVTEGWMEDPKVIEKVLAINFTSHCWTLREFLPQMIKNGRGHIVETCSALGVFASPACSAYVASKFAMRGYIESIKQDVRLLPSKPRIHFTLVYPNHVMTDMMARVDISHIKYQFAVKGMKPSYVAEKMVYGLLYGKEHVYVPAWNRTLFFLVNIFPPEAIQKLLDLGRVKPMHIELM